MRNNLDNYCQSIKYIDCRSWYDFSQQILAILAAAILAYRTINHYRNLKQEKQDQAITQHQKSIRRKIRVNLIQIIYLASFIISTILSIYLFFPYQNNKDFNKEEQAQVSLYRLSQILFINCLNILNLYVGFLYWKATRAYYILSGFSRPLLYRKCTKILFFIFFGLNIFAILVSGIDLIVDQQIINFKLFTLIATVISITACLACRLLYRQYILTKINLPQRAIFKQSILSVLLFISSFIRIFLYSFDIILTMVANKQWQSLVRNEQIVEDGKGCIDTSPFYAIILLGIDILVNFMPALIYGHLFVSEISTKYKKLKESQERPPRKNSKDSSF